MLGFDLHCGSTFKIGFGFGCLGLGFRVVSITATVALGCRLLSAALVRVEPRNISQPLRSQNEYPGPRA